jgi:hypothetical protein
MEVSIDDVDSETLAVLVRALFEKEVHNPSKFHTTPML